MHRPLAPHQRSELESQIGRALIHFEKEFMGRGPLETKTWLFEDMILVRLKGVLTPAERKLSEAQRDRSAYLLKQVRNELLCSGRPLLETVVHDIVGIPVQSIHTDISTKTGERIIVITLQEKLQFDRDSSLHDPREALTDESANGQRSKVV
jgi:uncharacterized protein YbcI